MGSMAATVAVNDAKFGKAFGEKYFLFKPGYRHLNQGQSSVGHTAFVSSQMIDDPQARLEAILDL